MRRSVKAVLVALATQTTLSACATAPPPPQHVSPTLRKACMAYADRIVEGGKKYAGIALILTGPYSLTQAAQDNDRRIMYNRCLAEPERANHGLKKQ
jgi:hypothetical protein